jgi:2-phosphosulfolactate phosphatase
MTFLAPHFSLVNLQNAVWRLQCIMPTIHLSRGAAGCDLAVGYRAVAIIVDALRASTTLAALFDHGAARVQVVAELDDACALGAGVPDAVLVGERNCLPPAGFHLGNSPREVLAGPRLDGRNVVFTSSNGAQRLTACAGARHILVGTVANAATLIARARALALAQDCDIVFVGAGKYPDEAYIAPEDEAAAVYLAMRIGLPISPLSREDFTYWQHAIATRGLADIFHASPHARYLVAAGLTEDIDYCATPDQLYSVPEMVGLVDLDGRGVGVELHVTPPG